MNNAARLVALVLMFTALGARLDGSTAPDLGGLKAETVSPEDVTGILNAVAALDRAQASEAVTACRDAEGLSWEGSLAARLVAAAALEAAGNADAARKVYQDIARKPKGESASASNLARSDTSAGRQPSPPQNPDERQQRMIDAYGATAAFRIRVLDSPAAPNAAANLYKTLSREEDKDGWYLIAGRWAWSGSRRAALRCFVNVCSDRISFRFFSYLASLSVFPKEYSYLFVLLALTIGAQILYLPLTARSVKAMLQMSRLQSQVEAIKAMHAFDPGAAQAEIQQLYRSQGIKLAPGCARAALDLAFVIWALVAMSDYSAQMILDGASLAWVGDVTRFSMGAVVAWAVASLVISVVQNDGTNISQKQLVISSLIMSFILALIARHWQWPAYVFIFWILLSLVGVIVHRITRGIGRAVWQ